MLRRRSLVLVTLLLAACTSGSTRAGSAASPNAPTSAAPSVISTPIPLTSRSQSLALPTAGKMLGTWQLAMTIGFGRSPSQLGLADTHGGKSPPWGPESGAPAPDGTWWFLDTNKHRLA